MSVHDAGSPGAGAGAAGQAGSAPWHRYLAGAAVPDPVALDAVARLAAADHPYRCDADALFLEALRELNAWHADRLDLYARLWAAGGAPVIDRIEDLDRQPLLHANLFKRHVLRSVPAAAVHVELSSSGTTGTPSRMCFDEWSLRAFQRMDARTFAFFGWAGADEPIDYLIFGREPHPLAQDQVRTGAAFSSEYICDFAPARSVTYALRHTGADPGDGEQHEFDLVGCVDALLRAGRDTVPLRIFGFPAFLLATLDRLRAIGAPPLRLPPGSLVLTGGGWKGHQDRAVPKQELVRRIGRQLVPYYECRHHHFHVTTWARALVRSVRTLEPVPDGEPGYLQLIAPYITSAPAHSVLMADLVTRHPGEACGCGIRTPWFTVLGRAGTSGGRSCAVAAADLLGGRA